MKSTADFAILFHLTISFFRRFFKPFAHILQIGKEPPDGQLFCLCDYLITSSTGQWSEPITSGWMQALTRRSDSFCDAMK